MHFKNSMNSLTVSYSFLIYTLECQINGGPYYVFIVNVKKRKLENVIQVIKKIFGIINKCEGVQINISPSRDVEKN